MFNNVIKNLLISAMINITILRENHRKPSFPGCSTRENPANK